ncbi:hypothetical protein HPB50_020321 [Hyalomma asiaticum]|uniref:Uncharacterized protein n=1 Tax=Hyalomma asiaticum TaxID=266040 RepID=A0ACB7RR32_HYAAI|nr:hypothetical protein HPB50_020321 [Hyalomma asiaticum]
MSWCGQREIARSLEITQATVARIVQAFREEHRIGDAPRHLNRKTSEDQDQLLVAAASEAPFMTAGQLRKAVGVDVSNDTVRRRLREAGLRNRAAAQKPKLSAASTVKRLQFARDHLQWTTDDW